MVFVHIFHRRVTGTSVVGFLEPIESFGADVQAFGQRATGLDGPAHGAGDDGVDGFASQEVGRRLSLTEAERRKRWVSRAVIANLGLGERVPDDEEFHDPQTYAPPPFWPLVGLRCQEPSCLTVAIRCPSPSS